MPVSSVNTNVVQQNKSAAGSNQGNGIMLKAPVQKKDGDLETASEDSDISIYTSGNTSAVPQFKLSPLQFKTNTFSAASVNAPLQPIVQRVLLSNGQDTDNFTFAELEGMVNGGVLDDADITIIEKVMDKMKGGKPASLNFKGAEEPDDAYSDHEFFNFDSIPKSTHQEHIVGGYFYRFWNDAYRCVEFSDPKDKGAAKATPVKIEQQVNIKNGSKIKHIPTENLKQPKRKNYYHFKAANIEAGLGTAGTSPAGKTWHHHHTEGQMELLDRDVHAEFKHAGGKKYWGSV